MLNENLKMYSQLLEQEEALKNSKEALRQEILKELSDLGETKYTSPDGINAVVASKATIKYSDENAILRYLKDNGYTKYIVEKIDNTNLNKELKKYTTLTESLKPYYTVSESPALTVKLLNE